MMKNFKIFDSLGKEVKNYSITSNRIDIRNLSKGFYILHSKISDFTISETFIKK